jgi:hypothetical protein
VALLAVAGLIACKDAGLLDAFSYPWTPPSTFYKLLEIERALFPDSLLGNCIAIWTRELSPAAIVAAAITIAAAIIAFID